MHARANCRKSSHIKKSSKHRGLYTTRPYAKKIIVYHEGISLPLHAGKVCETGHIKKAKSGEYKKEYPPSLWLLGICSGDRRGEGFPTLAGFVVKGDALHGAASPCKKKRAVVQCPRPGEGCPCVCLLAGARAFFMPPSCAWTHDAGRALGRPETCGPEDFMSRNPPC